MSYWVNATKSNPDHGAIKFQFYFAIEYNTTFFVTEAKALSFRLLPYNSGA